MIDICAMNSTPPSVFTFLVSKLHNFCPKDPTAKGGSQQKIVINYRFSVLKMTAQITQTDFFLNLSPQTCKGAEKFAKTFPRIIHCSVASI